MQKSVIGMEVLPVPNIRNGEISSNEFFKVPFRGFRGNRLLGTS